MQHKFIE